MAPKTGNSKTLRWTTYLWNSNGYIYVFGSTKSKGRMSDTDR